MRLKIVVAFPLLLFLLWITSCRKDFDYAPSAGNLSFSKDTVYLDTVFSNIGSSTYTLKVYNESKDDVLIPSIFLKKGNESFYRLNVDGVAGKSFTDIPIYAKDSLFILIETTVEITDNSKELLYTDAIQFDNEPFDQTVELVTLAKDAIFLYPKPTTHGQMESVVFDFDGNGNEISLAAFEFKDEELTLTNEKPYVMYGYGIVPSGKDLHIEAGARVHFHKDSGILVNNGATLTVKGNLSEDQELMEGEVIFEGNRLEPEFSETPGQWGAIWIARGSKGNTIEYLTLKNAEIGLFVEGATDPSLNSLTIQNSQVYNNSRHNIWSRNATLVAENLVLGGAGAASLRFENGGSYEFTHCTIANYWNKGFRTSPALEISNFYNVQENGADLLKADFKNCIIDGNNLTELSLISNGINVFNFSFQNCLITYNQNRTTDDQSNFYDFSDPEYYSAILLNASADFFLPSKNDLRIGQVSEVINLGGINSALTVPSDILGISRTNTPDLGAYQARERPE